MQHISENVTLHHVDRIVVRDARVRLEFQVDDEETYLWDGEADAEWEIEDAVVTSAEDDHEGVVARPVDDYFVCEINANRAVDNVGPVHCRSVEGER